MDPPQLFVDKSIAQWKLIGKENQFIITGFRIRFNSKINAGQFTDHQLTGGVDDASGAKMTANR